METPLLHMPNHADDLQPVSVAPDTDAPTDRVSVGEILAGKDFVDNNDRGSAFIILIGKKPALLERNPHGLQITGFDAIHQSHVHFTAARRLGLSIGPEIEIV